MFECLNVCVYIILFTNIGLPYNLTDIWNSSLKVMKIQVFLKKWENSSDSR